MVKKRNKRKKSPKKSDGIPKAEAELPLEQTKSSEPSNKSQNKPDLPGDEADPQVQAGDESKVDAQTDAEAEKTPNAEVDTKDESKSDAQTEAEGGHKTEAKAETEDESKSDAQAEAKTEAEAEAEAEDKSESDAPSEAEDENKAGASPGMSDEELEKAIEDLVEFVLDQGGRPMDRWAVAALLESRGLRDVDAIEQYRERHIYGLALKIYDLACAQDDENRVEENEHKPPSFGKQVSDFIKFYTKGTVFALPMAGQIAAILILRYSLWAWLEFTVMQASLVALGTMASFMASGGLIQAIGREGTFYQGQLNPLLLERICIRLTRAGVGITIVLSTLTLILNAIFPYFRFGQLTITLLYFALLTPLWLLLAVLYMLQDNLAILACTLIGTAAVHLVMMASPGNIHLAHALGLIVASIAASIWAWYRIRQKKVGMDKKCELAALPRPAILLFVIEPFVIYGTLYFTFLFVDRIVGWSSSSYRQPLIIWFRTSYELGMDWALLSLVLTFAVLEYTVNQFNLLLIPIQESVFATQYKRHNRYFMRFYIRQNILLAVVSVISIIVTYLAVLQLKQLDHIQEVRDFFASPITYFTYWGAAIGYAFLAFALLNALFFFSLAKPAIVIRCIAWGLVVDIAVAYILSRTIAYQYSVFGLIAGSFVFAVLIGRKAIQMFRQLDYYYYSAF